MTESSSRSTLPDAKDTRLLLVGVAAFLVLAVYLIVAFVRTHATNGLLPTEANHAAPWTPFESKLIPVQRPDGKYSVWVFPATKGPSYGAVAQTLVSDPPPGRYTIGLWLRGARPGEIGVEVNEFRSGVARYPVQTTVPATRKWHHFTFTLQVKDRFLGLAMFAYRPAKAPRRTWFAIRNVTVAFSKR